MSAFTRNGLDLVGLILDLGDQEEASADGIARHAAKCFNCVGIDGKGRDVTCVPCGKCERCDQTHRSMDIDVQENDARYLFPDAKHIRDSAAYGPAVARYGVRIVHNAQLVIPETWAAFADVLNGFGRRQKVVFVTGDVASIPAEVVQLCRYVSLFPREVN